MSLRLQLKSLWHRGDQWANFFAPIANLAIRMEIFNVFFRAGWLKFSHWPSTLYLFQHEYAVPMLSYKVAAVLGTATELTVPFFILLGLGGRLPAMIMFVFNAIAVISFATLWEQAAGHGLQQHFYWGLMLLVIWLHGSGPLSLDGCMAYVSRSWRK